MRNEITAFVHDHPYRLLCTATAAPNDYMELGTSSEALGEMRRAEMLGMFFAHDGGETSKWRVKGHAQAPFWRWVCSWARAMRKPSDLGFDDAGFELPPLTQREHIVKAKTIQEDYLFEMPAISLDEQRDELRRTLTERCEMAADLINAHSKPAVAWCHLNAEGHLLQKLIPDSVEIQGSDSDDKKEAVFHDFAAGRLRVLVTKPSIAGFGLNWQHCAHETFFPSHSYEAYYQAIRRCWRFGQTKPVTADIISTEGQSRVLANMNRKAEAADRMFDFIVAHMRDELKIGKKQTATKKERIPAWL